ncbi:hypothetical protein IG631_14308 [Alternaria alternata]|nr:hypothetical protein IG631_14308 [Alternaria alternata]
MSHTLLRWRTNQVLKRNVAKMVGERTGCKVGAAFDPPTHANAKSAAKVRVTVSLLSLDLCAVQALPVKYDHYSVVEPSSLTTKLDKFLHKSLVISTAMSFSIYSPPVLTMTELQNIETRVLPWSLGSFKCVYGNKSVRPVATFRRWLAKFPPEFRRAITSIILVDTKIGDAPLEDEVLKEWTTRSNLSLQDFPGLKRIQVQVGSPLSKEDLRKMVMIDARSRAMMDARSKMGCLGRDDTRDRLEPRERITGNVCV